MEKPQFIPYEKAKDIVAEVVEMEHPREDGKRIFNVYGHKGQSLCWFDADEVEAEIDAREFKEVKEHILHFIPEWALESS